ncbi:MAG: UDP-N-acetylmuramoyl-L-alanyl-D-glutamate--2,6-diaminopimelate ligase [Alphaproteobacteria bacterium]|nr:MAG: UDP-N-acetylmuramoyl-L-alanyl-D-glutamate--2,6-diaminopimelate ligase [Alphaproteobacteria bacterium]
MTEVVADSRAATPGCLFVAVSGVKLDGAQFIADAVARGAVAVLAARGTRAAGALPVPVIEADDPRLALAHLAARRYPRQPGAIAAVTGTNGKTSTAWFTRLMWQAMGHRAASLGTIGFVRPDRPIEDTLTTPDPLTLHRMLDDAAADGIDHLAMEASSHGLDQRRLDGVRLASAAFTNLTHEHLDYHGTMADYFAAKARLFEVLLPAGAAAVLNRDIAQFDDLAAIAKRRGHRVITFGRCQADLSLNERRPTPTGQDLSLTVFGTRVDLHLPLIGGFQVENALAALGLVIGAGAEPARATQTLRTLGVVPGRMELVARSASGAPIFVDYAHKPDALETVLTAARPHCAGKLVVVVGCGGDRDRAKRPMMGSIACRLSDRAIITDDNPRSEDPALIRKAMLAGCDTCIAEEIGDRRQAIHTAVASLGARDLLIIAGKGHERGQIIGTTVLPFDDAAVAREAAGGGA